MPDTFPFPNHTCTWAYPKGDSFQFGKGYEFSAAPQLPLQRKFKLKFKAMIWHKDETGTPVSSIDPENNILAFDEFYREHLTHIAFYYQHEVYGQLLVKFSSEIPFEMPATLEGGAGVTEEFEINLVEQPR